MLVRSLVAAAVLALAAQASAAEPGGGDGLEPFLEPSAEREDQGVSLGLRGAYALPMGSYSGAPNASLSDVFSGALPLEADVGYRLNRFYFGGFFTYAPAFTASGLGCESGVSCSGHFIRLGVEAQYAILPRARQLSPWVGLGFGYEWAHIEVSNTSAGASINLNGFEFVDLQAGLDFRLGAFRAGPFAALSVGQYSSASATAQNGGNTGSAAVDVQDKAFHEWLQLGARVALDI